MFSARSGYQYSRRRRLRPSRRWCPRRPRRRPRRHLPPSRCLCGKALTVTWLPSLRRHSRRRRCRSSALTLSAGLAGAVRARCPCPFLPAPRLRCAPVAALRPMCPAPTMRCRVRTFVPSAPCVRMWVRRRPVTVRAYIRRSSCRLQRPMRGGTGRRLCSSRTAAAGSPWRTLAIGFGRPLARWSSLSMSTRERLPLPMCPCRRGIWTGSCTLRCRPHACRLRTCCDLFCRRWVALCLPTSWSWSVACPAPPTRPVVVATRIRTVCPGLSFLAPARVAWRTCFGANYLPRSSGFAVRLLTSPFSWSSLLAPCFGAIRR